MEKIQSGKFSVAISQARDYLNYILKDKPGKAAVELYLFEESLRQFVKMD